MMRSWQMALAVGLLMGILGLGFGEPPRWSDDRAVRDFDGPRHGPVVGHTPPPSNGLAWND
jgi:hypothetical protein